VVVSQRSIFGLTAAKDRDLRVGDVGSVPSGDSSGRKDTCTSTMGFALREGRITFPFIAFLCSKLIALGYNFLNMDVSRNWEGGRAEKAFFMESDQSQRKNQPMK